MRHMLSDPLVASFPGLNLVLRIWASDVAYIALGIHWIEYHLPWIAWGLLLSLLPG
jgi:hypothetical protein